MNETRTLPCRGPDTEYRNADNCGHVWLAKKHGRCAYQQENYWSGLVS